MNGPLPDPHAQRCFCRQTADGERVEVNIVLVTGNASPKLPPELCVHLTRVSFALPPLVLEERLLK